MQNRILKWEEIETNLAKYKFLFQRFDIIIGINRGGLPLSVMASYLAKKPHGVLSISTYDENNKSTLLEFDNRLSVAQKGPFEKVLCLDDISDSGKSLFVAIKILENLGYKRESIKIFTYYWKKKSLIKPDYYLEIVDNDTWINFPWSLEGK